MDIQALIERVQNGDTDSFEPIIHLYEQSLFRYCCFLLGNKQEAEDAVQDILFQAYRHMHKVDSTKPLRPWLYTIAQNHCYNMLKKRKRWLSLLPLFRSGDPPAKSAEQVAAERFDGEFGEIARWIQGLSAQEKHLLVLRVVEECTFEEIGRMMNEKPTTIRKRFERLRRKLVRQHRHSYDEQKEVIRHEQQYELR